jgi:serine/threonine protein kinase
MFPHHQPHRQSLSGKIDSSVLTILLNGSSCIGLVATILFTSTIASKTIATKSFENWVRGRSRLFGSQLITRTQSIASTFYIPVKCVCINRSSTVQYVALKIEIAKVLKPSHEVTIFQHLSNASDISTSHVAKLLDQFNHEGPNGVHSCLVLELMGASVGSIIDDLPRSNPRRRGNYPIWMTKRILREVLKGLTFLHQNNVVHGDLNRGNILFTLKSLTQYGNDDLAQDESFKWGSISDPVERIDGKIDKWAPKYLTVPQPLTAFTNISETCSIKLSDFGGGTYHRVLFV